MFKNSGSGLFGVNYLDEKTCSLIGCMEGGLMIPANSVKLSSLLQTVYEFHKFSAKNPGLFYLYDFILIISSLRIPPLLPFARNNLSEPEFFNIYWRLKSRLFEESRLFRGQSIQQASQWLRFCVCVF
jgi:hypothetical protein